MFLKRRYGETKGHHESFKVRQENDVNLYVIIIAKLVVFRLPREDSLVFSLIFGKIKQL